jgi:hypothetical protein
MGPPHGISVGKPLMGFRGILTGVPEVLGGSETLVTPDAPMKSGIDVER